MLTTSTCTPRTPNVQGLPSLPSTPTPHSFSLAAAAALAAPASLYMHTSATPANLCMFSTGPVLYVHKLVGAVKLMLSALGARLQATGCVPIHLYSHMLGCVPHRGKACRDT